MKFKSKQIFDKLWVREFDSSTF